MPGRRHGLYQRCTSSAGVTVLRSWPHIRTLSSSRNTRVAEAALCGAGTTRHCLRAVRFEAGGIQQPRVARRQGLLQPGEPERIRAREHAGRPFRAGVHENARAIGCACAERRRRLRPRVEQERSGYAPAVDGNRYALVDHVQRCHRAPRVQRPDSVAGHPQTRSGWQRCAHSRGGVIGACRVDLCRRSSVWLPDNLFLLRRTASRSRSGHRPAGVPWWGTAVCHARENARALQPVSLAGLQSR